MNMKNPPVFLTKFEEVRIYNELGWRGKMKYQVYLDSFFVQEFAINFYVLLLLVPQNIERLYWHPYF